MTDWLDDGTVQPCDCFYCEDAYADSDDEFVPDDDEPAGDIGWGPRIETATVDGGLL